MEKIGSLFIGLVVFANTVVPSANLPQVLGIEDEVKSATESSEKQRNKKDLIKNRTEERKEKREEFREKVSTIKDERKQKVLERVSENIENINARRVEHYKKFLERLKSVLSKMVARGADSALVTNAQTSIAELENLITGQESKSYTIEIGDDSNLGQSTKDAIQSMRTDLKAIEDKLKSTKETVVMVAKSVQGSKNE